MPTLRIDETLELYYELDDHTDPWTEPETILLVRGIADTSKAWFAWVPRLARQFRVLRPDMRGFGHSSVPPADYAWSLSGFAQDLRRLLDQLELSSVHFVGQRVGGSVAMQFAHDHPERVQSLTVIGGPATLSQSSLDPDAWLAQVQEDGVEAWARSTMDRRLGDVSPAMKEWWITEMGKSSPEVMAGIFRYVGSMDITALLPQIQPPTLVITSDRSALAPVETVRDWQTKIPNSQLLVLPSPAYHLGMPLLLFKLSNSSQRSLVFLRKLRRDLRRKQLYILEQLLLGFEAVVANQGKVLERNLLVNFGYLLFDLIHRTRHDQSRSNMEPLPSLSRTGKKCEANSEKNGTIHFSTFS